MARRMPMPTQNTKHQGPMRIAKDAQSSVMVCMYTVWTAVPVLRSASQSLHCRVHRSPHIALLILQSSYCSPYIAECIAVLILQSSYCSPHIAECVDAGLLSGLPVETTGWFAGLYTVRREASEHLKPVVVVK
jgi:hypothetical protein